MRTGPIRVVSILNGPIHVLTPMASITGGASALFDLATLLLFSHIQHIVHSYDGRQSCNLLSAQQGNQYMRYTYPAVNFQPTANDEEAIPHRKWKNKAKTRTGKRKEQKTQKATTKKQTSSLAVNKN